MSTPEEVWGKITRADELVKYAGNREPGAAYAQARAVLDEAEAAARALSDAAAAKRFLEHISLRRDDIDRYDT